MVYSVHINMQMYTVLRVSNSNVLPYLIATWRCIPGHFKLKIKLSNFKNEMLKPLDCQNIGNRKWAFKGNYHFFSFKKVIDSQCYMDESTCLTWYNVNDTKIGREYKY